MMSRKQLTPEEQAAQAAEQMRRNITAATTISTFNPIFALNTAQSALLQNFMLGKDAAQRQRSTSSAQAGVKVMTAKAGAVSADDGAAIGAVAVPKDGKMYQADADGTVSFDGPISNALSVDPGLNRYLDLATVLAKLDQATSTHPKRTTEQFEAIIALYLHDFNNRLHPILQTDGILELQKRILRDSIFNTVLANCLGVKTQLGIEAKAQRVTSKSIRKILPKWGTDANVDPQGIIKQLSDKAYIGQLNQLVKKTLKRDPRTKGHSKRKELSQLYAIADLTAPNGAAEHEALHAVIELAIKNYEAGDETKQDYRDVLTNPLVLLTLTKMLCPPVEATMAATQTVQADVGTGTHKKDTGLKVDTSSSLAQKHAALAKLVASRSQQHLQNNNVTPAEATTAEATTTPAEATTPEAKSGTRETQFSRAVRELDIDLIHANTPQAKGRRKKTAPPPRKHSGSESDNEDAPKPPPRGKKKPARSPRKLSDSKRTLAATAQQQEKEQEQPPVVPPRINRPGSGSSSTSE